MGFLHRRQLTNDPKMCSIESFWINWTLVHWALFTFGNQLELHFIEPISWWWRRRWWSCVCSWLFFPLENIIWNSVIFLRIDKTNRFHLFCDTLLIVYSVKLDLAVWKIEKELSFSERTQNAQNGNGKFKCVCFLLTGRHPKVWVSSTVKWCISLSSYFDVLRVSEWQDIWKEGVIKFNMATATSQPK